MHTVKKTVLRNTMSTVIALALAILSGACDTGPVVTPSDIDAFASPFNEEISKRDAEPIQTIAALPEEPTADPQTTVSPESSSAAPESTAIVPETASDPISVTYILNKNTKKFHYPTCKSAKQIKESNKESFIGSRDDVIAMGYKPCGSCHP